MSAIPVVMEILLQKDETLASLQEFNQQAQSVINEMRSIEPVSIDLRIDDQASYRATDIINGVRSDVVPIEIPLRLDTSSFAAQMAEVREMMAAQPPIIIPVQYVPIGGAGGAVGGAAAEGAVGGIAAGLGTVAATTAAGAMFGPEGAVAGAAEGLGEATVPSAMEEGLGMEAGSLEPSEEEGIQGEANSLYNKMLRGRPGAPKSSHWYQYAGMGRHAFLGGYVAYKGLSSLTGKLTNSEYREKLNAEPDSMKQFEMERQQVEKDNEGWLAGLKHEIWHEPSHEQSLRYISNAEETLRQEKERDAAFKKNMPEIASLRGNLTEMNDELGGITGSANDHIRATIAKQYSAAMKELDKAADSAKNNAPGAKEIRELVTKTRETAQKIFDAHNSVLDEQERVTRSRMYAQGDAALDRSLGDYAGARKLEFKGRIEDQYNQIKAHDPARAEEFMKSVAPLLTREFDQEENLHDTDLASENRYVASSSFAKDAEHRAQQLHDPVGAAQAANQEIDARIKKLKEEADAEAQYGDKEKAKTLATEASAAVTEGAAEKQKNLAEATEEAARRTEEYTRSMRDMSEEARSTWFQAHGEGYTAERESAETKYQDELGQISVDKTLTPAQKKAKSDAAKAERDAQLDSIEQGRQREFRGIGAKTAEYQWQSTNHPRYAELVGMEHDISEQLRDHSDDPQMQRELRQEGAAQLTAFALPNQQSRWYSSAADYAKALNTGYLNQDQQASKEALEAAKELKEGVKEWRHIMQESPGVQIIRNGY